MPKRVFDRLVGVRPSSPEEWENLRRSIAMLSPGQATHLDRETALAALDELANHHERQRRARQLVLSDKLVEHRRVS